MPEVEMYGEHHPAQESRPEICILGGPVPGRPGGVATFINGLTEVAQALGFHVWRGDGLWPPQRARYRKLDIAFRLFEKTSAAIRARRRGALVIENAQLWKHPLSLRLARQHAEIVAGRYVLVIHKGTFPNDVRSFSRAHQAAIVKLSSHLVSIVCVNPAMKDALLEIGVPTKALSVVSSVVGSLASPARHQIPRRLQQWLAAHTPVLVATGAMMAAYGFNTIVGCTAELRKIFPQLGCLLFARTAWSDDEYEKTVYETIRRLDMKEYCLVEYDIPYVSPVLEVSDVLLRLVDDSAGICLYEAAYAGCDSVAYANPTRPSFTFTVPDGDVEAMIAATRRCLELRQTDPSRRDELKQAAAAHLAQNNDRLRSLLLAIGGKP